LKPNAGGGAAYRPKIKIVLMDYIKQRIHIDSQLEE
jgi:hypothetical protein